MKLGLLSAMAWIVLTATPVAFADQNQNQNQDDDRTANESRRRPEPGDREVRSTSAAYGFHDSILLQGGQVAIEARILIVATDDRALGIDLGGIVRRNDRSIRITLEDLPVLGDLFGPVEEPTPPNEKPVGEAFLIGDTFVLDLRSPGGLAATAVVTSGRRDAALTLIDVWSRSIRGGTGTPLGLVDLQIPGAVPPLVVDQIEVRTRRADSTVTIRDGQTVDLGGVVSTDETDAEKKVPKLGDLPFLGQLFKSTGQAYGDRRNLVILVTPRIVIADEE